MDLPLAKHIYVFSVVQRLGTPPPKSKRIIDVPMPDYSDKVLATLQEQEMSELSVMVKETAYHILRRH